MRVVTKIVLPGHDLDARRRANWRRVTTIKLHALPSKLVNIRCLVILTAVTSKRLPAHIVGHDQHNVGLSLI